MQAKQIKKGLPGSGAIWEDSISRNKQEVTSYPPRIKFVVLPAFTSCLSSNSGSFEEQELIFTFWLQSSLMFVFMIAHSRLKLNMLAFFLCFCKHLFQTL